MLPISSLLPSREWPCKIRKVTQDLPMNEIKKESRADLTPFLPSGATMALGNFGQAESIDDGCI
jgi:hypothetical protein